VFPLPVFQYPGGLIVPVRQIGDRGQPFPLFVVWIAFQGHVPTTQPGFHFHHFFRLHRQFCGNLGGFRRAQGVRVRFHAAQIEEQLALGLGGGNLHQAPVAHDVFVDFRLDPVDGEGHQTHPPIRIKALDRLHQADIAFLDQVRMGQAVTQVAPGDGNDQAQMGKYQLPGRIQVVVIPKTLGQRQFLFLPQYWEALGGLNISVQIACRGGQGESLR